MLRGIEKPAGGELARVTRPRPDRVRERVLRGCRRVVSDRSATKIVCQLYRAGTIPPCGRTEGTFRGCEVVGRALLQRNYSKTLVIRAGTVTRRALWCRMTTETWTS